jgi:hypothetical protein
MKYLGVVGVDEGVIDSNHLHVWVALRCPEHQAPDAAKAVDAHLLQPGGVSTCRETGCADMDLPR